MLFRYVFTDEIDLFQIFNASPNAYVLFDQCLTIVGCNKAYLAAVGRTTANEIVGRNLFEAFPSPADSPSNLLLRRSLDSVLTEERRDHIAIIPYDTSLPHEPPNMRYWSATHTPIFNREGRLTYILQHTVDISELQKLRERDARETIAEAGVLYRASQVQEANEALKTETQFIRHMFRQAPGFTAVLAGPAHTFIVANEAYIRLIGGRDPVGLTLAEAIPEVVGQGFVDLLDGVYRSGEPYVGREIAVTLQQPDTGETQHLFLDFIYQPLLSADGSVTGVFVQGQDVTDRANAKRLELLRNREIAHRLKNQLTVIQAIVNQTLRASSDISTARDTIAGRTGALARAHDVLISNNLGQSTVAEIVEQTRLIFDDHLIRRFHVEGPEVAIASRPALSLALLLHELSTNAVKYGALSRDGGTVHLHWSTSAHAGSKEFALEWREAGGPKVVEPTHSSAGTKLIRAGLSGTAWSRVSLDWSADGLICRVVADLDSLNDDGFESPQ